MFESVSAILLQIFLCFLVADFITGLLHWFEDTMCDPNTPLIGKLVIAYNVLHHEDPRHMTMSGIVYRNRDPLVLAIAFIIFFTLFFGFSWQVALVAFFASFGNEVHCWNHIPKKELPRSISFIMEFGILQTRLQHGTHHIPPYDKSFCTLSNILNPILDLGFWKILEKSLSLLGFKIKRGSEERRGV